MIQVTCLTKLATQPWPHLTRQPPPPRCEAQRITKYLNDTPSTSGQCLHSAKFVIAGKHLCLRHAEIADLVYLLEQQP
ncbi:MAG TPA: hypothetical protein VMS38_28735 [Pseudorhodoferax sp.]|nr:hypothetical protein [Pseudorhodoferax sp.]